MVPSFHGAAKTGSIIVLSFPLIVAFGDFIEHPCAHRDEFVAMLQSLAHADIDHRGQREADAGPFFSLIQHGDSSQGTLFRGSNVRLGWKI